MAVQYLKYEGKRYPIKLGYYSMHKFAVEHGGSVEDAKENIQLMEPLLFLALQQGSRVTKEPLTLVEEDMVDMLDEVLKEFTDAIPKFFPDEEDLAKNLAEPAKKPPTGQTRKKK